jgi:serine kinase of HPr protein (carbohydrate metabolism regulator)
MTVQELIEKNQFKIINTGEGLENIITTPFCCDLLSIAMSKAPTNSAWITVMGNINTLAVATLTEVACIILAEGAVLDQTALEKAKMQKITILRTEDSIFDTALLVYQMIHD